MEYRGLVTYKTGKQLEEAYEAKTGKPWPFLISGQDMLDMADPGFAKFMHGIVGPTLKKIAKDKAEVGT